jgi:hypothetical protein
LIEWNTSLIFLSDCFFFFFFFFALPGQVLSGFAVQETTLRLAGKGLFPLWDLFVHRGLGVEVVLPRYRVHMGIW